ncbi:MAG TPA: hypothetical protein ENI87_14725 [bacterium]|nr:hypothetical protein [bacterium]
MTQFTTPDGSRFALVVDDSMDLVHWSVATWADGRDDPAGLEGLALTTAQASLGGTWQTGSKDPAAERQLLAKLDEAWQRRLLEPADAAANESIVALDKACAELGDVRTFARVLAAAPVHRAEVVDRGHVAVLALTTVAEALPTVAELLLERREQQALRGLYRTWMSNLLARMQRFASDRDRRMHAEVLALLMPFSPAAAQLEPPQNRAPRRAQALSTWAHSQHPTRTAHVLYGNFDADATRTVLERVFSDTSLPDPPPERELRLRPLTTQRRSVVPGAGPRITMAWVLPPIADPFVLRACLAFLFDGEHGVVLRKMRRRHQGLEITAMAPWPPRENGRSLLLLDLRTPEATATIADELVALCRRAANEELPQGHYYRANVAMQREWLTAAASPRELAMTLAETALVWPALPVSPDQPRARKGAQIRDLIAQMFASQPVIVEGRP